MKFFKNLVVNTFFAKWAGIVFVMLFVVYIAAIKFNWFYIFPHFDVPMHVVGGLLAGLIALALSVRDMNPLQRLMWVIFWTLIAGIAVEIVEWLFDRYGHLSTVLQPSAWDTYTDILHDMIGGTIAFVLGYFSGKV
jgi:FtsH-binding integral membrane protein